MRLGATSSSNNSSRVNRKGREGRGVLAVSMSRWLCLTVVDVDSRQFHAAKRSKSGLFALLPNGLRSAALKLCKISCVTKLFACMKRLVDDTE